MRSGGQEHRARRALWLVAERGVLDTRKQEVSQVSRSDGHGRHHADDLGSRGATAQPGAVPICFAGSARLR
jgi:hypothetical protein